MDPDFPGPGEHQQRQERDEIVSRGDEIQQAMGRTRGNGHVEGGPKGHGGDEREDGSHGLDPEAGENLAAHEVGKTGGHSAGRAGNSSASLELTFLETELAMRAQSVGAGLEFGGDEENSQAGEGDGQGNEAEAKGETVGGLWPYIYGGRGVHLMMEFSRVNWGRQRDFDLPSLVCVEDCLSARGIAFA